MKGIRHKILVIPVLMIAIGLIYGSVTTSPVVAQTAAGCSERDPQGCPNFSCENQEGFNDTGKLGVECCWSYYNEGKLYCQTFMKDPYTGQMEKVGGTIDLTIFQTPGHHNIDILNGYNNSDDRQELLE